MYSVLIVFVAVIAISTASPITSSPRVCLQPFSVGNPTIADLAGSLQYIKYANRQNVQSNLDGKAFRFDRQGDSNNYTVTIISVFNDGTKEENTSYWLEHTIENTSLLLKKEEQKVYYSIPYLEKNGSSVLHMCTWVLLNYSFPPIKLQVTQVITPNLDNDLTKAVEEARKIAISDLKELPFRFKNAFTD